MKYFKRFLKIACVVLAILVVEGACRFCLLETKSSHYYKYDYRRLASNIETVFCGASHVLNGIDPNYFNDGEDGIAFVSAAGALQMDVLYYRVKDFIRHSAVKTVYLDLSPGLFYRSEIVDDLYTVRAIHEIRSPLIRLQAVANCMEPNNWDDYVFFSKYSLSINSKTDDVRALVKEKLSVEYRTYASPPEHYSLGFAYAEGHSKEFDYDLKLAEYREKKKTISLNEDKVAYLRKLIRLCQKENVDLILFTVIEPAAYVYGHENYEEIHTFFRDIANENGLPYYDFNYYVGRADLFDEHAHFYDKSHLNKDGADIFSALLSDWIREGKPDRFYASAQEMLQTYDLFTPQPVQ